MRFSWDDKQAIHPIWPAKGYPYIVIPGDAQKNGNDETIPMLPGLKKLLGKIPEEQSTGWIFNPTTVIDPRVRKMNHSRPETDWVSRVIAKIGFHANVLVRGSEKDRVAFLAWKNQTAEVRKAAPYSGPTVKFASAHDLRRSLAERLREEGVSPLIITRVLRHSSWEVTSRFYAPGEVQREALELHKQLEK